MYNTEQTLQEFKELTGAVLVSDLRKYAFKDYVHEDRGVLLHRSSRLCTTLMERIEDVVRLRLLNHGVLLAAVKEIRVTPQNTILILPYSLIEYVSLSGTYKHWELLKSSLVRLKEDDAEAALTTSKPDVKTLMRTVSGVARALSDEALQDIINAYEAVQEQLNK